MTTIPGPALWCASLRRPPAAAADLLREAHRGLPSARRFLCSKKAVVNEASAFEPAITSTASSVLERNVKRSPKPWGRYDDLDSPPRGEPTPRNFRKSIFQNYEISDDVVPPRAQLSFGLSGGHFELISPSCGAFAGRKDGLYSVEPVQGVSAHYERHGDTASEAFSEKMSVYPCTSRRGALIYAAKAHRLFACLKMDCMKETRWAKRGRISSWAC
eukprot:scaffold1023_cov313-Pinguiococcus_pyrenoidosus.AAC.23